MNFLTIYTYIDAPKDEVFRIVADIRNFSDVIPEITDVEFLREQKFGVGTKFRETRNMKGKESTTELEVTELVDNEYIRIVSDAGGSIWDSIFRVEDNNDGTDLYLKMEARPYKLLAKVMTPFMKGFMRNAIEKDMLAVKEFCEQGKV